MPTMAKQEHIENCHVKASHASRDDVVPGDNTFRCPVTIKWVELALVDGKITCMDKDCEHSREYYESDGGLIS
jgi:hypothetical protein